MKAPRPLFTILPTTLISIAMLCLSASAEVYKTVDENGKVTFTDTPPADDTSAEKVELPPINGQPPVTPTTRRPPPQNQDTVPTKYKVLITSPKNDTQVLADQSSISIQVALEPGLHRSHRVEIYDNGQLISDEGSSITISNLGRGTHSISAKVVTKGGRVLGTAPSVQFHVFRPSALTRSRFGL